MHIKFQSFQILAAGHHGRADNMSLASKTERLLLLLGQAASVAPSPLHRMEFLRIRASISQRFQIVAAVAYIHDEQIT